MGGASLDRVTVVEDNRKEGVSRNERSYHPRRTTKPSVVRRYPLKTMHCCYAMRPECLRIQTVVNCVELVRVTLVDTNLTVTHHLITECDRVDKPATILELVQ